MDKIVDKIIGLGIPGLILLFMIELTGFAGAAAITTALATLGGPFGMLGGIAVLGVMVLISSAIARYGFDNIAVKVISGLKTKGHSQNEIFSKIDSLPLSQDLKRRLKDHISKLFHKENEGGI